MRTVAFTGHLGPSRPSGDAATAAATVTENSRKERELPGSIHYSFGDLSGQWKFLADNEFIKSGYRLALTWEQCFWSLFQVHNETVNVWTHFVGGLLFVSLIVYTSVVYWELHPHVERYCAPHRVQRDGMHTRYMLDRVVFYPDTVFPDPCTSQCESVSTVSWMQSVMMKQSQDLRQMLQTALPGSMHDRLEALEMHLEEMRETLSTFRKDMSSSAAERLATLRFAANEQLSVLGDMVSEGTHMADEAMHHSLATAMNALEEMASVSHSAEVSKWPIMVFLISAATCLTASSIFHLFFCMGPNAFSTLSKLDYSGISILICGSTIPHFYYGFYCSPNLAAVYIAMSVSVCGIATAVTFMPLFSRPNLRPFRSGVYITTAAVGGVPLVHLIFMHGFHSDVIQAVFWHLLWMGCLYVGGALLYAMRIPERWYPGRFDLVFSSHQIFHIMVVSAAIVHYYGVIAHYEWRQLHTICLV